MKKILFAIAMGFLMTPAMAQHRDIHRDNHHDSRRPVPPPSRIATQEEAGMIYHYIKSLSFDKDKVEGIKICMQLAPMMAEDVARLVELVSFDDSRLEALEFCYPLCPNRSRYAITVDRLTFQSNKDKLMRFMAAH